MSKKLTKEELDQLVITFFDNYDKDKSGSIDVKELKACMDDLSDEIGIDRPTEE